MEKWKSRSNEWQRMQKALGIISLRQVEPKNKPSKTITLKTNINEPSHFC